MESKVYERSGEPRFNSALDLLERISIILKRLAFLHILYPNNLIAKQREHISLVRNFYKIAIPILPINMIEKYDDEILDFRMKHIMNVKSGVQKVNESYSFEIEKRLDQILIDLQLSIKYYFMPQGEGDDYEL